jgi:hypothetical protein
MRVACDVDNSACGEQFLDDVIEGPAASSQKHDESDHA